MNKIKSHWKLGLLPLYAIIVILAVSFLYSYTTTDVDTLFLTPTFQDARGWEIYTLDEHGKTEKTTQELFDSSEETFYLSRKLDKTLEQEGYTIMELDSFTWQQSVFLDDELLYTVDPSLDNRIGKVKFPDQYTGIQKENEYVRFTLPSDYGGKTLTIAVAYNSMKEYQGMPMIRLSSEMINTQLLVSNTSSLSMPATAYMMAAILLLGLFFFNLYYGKKSYATLFLMIAAVIQSLRIFLNFEYRFGSRYSLLFLPAELLMPLSLGIPLLYMLTQMKRWKKWYAPFVFLPLGLSILFHLLAKIPMFSILSYYPYDALLYLSLLSLGVFAVLEWKDKNTVYRLFTPLFFGVVICILIGSLSLSITGHEETMMVTMLRAPILMMSEAFQRYGSLLLILGGTVSFILTIRNVADTKSELSILAIRNELINENIQNMQESSTEIAILRHDMLRHLHMLQDLSREGDKERMDHYLEELTEKTENVLPLKICSHPIVNALLSRALVKAKKEDIQMILQVEVPSDITIDDNDLCTLIMNMLDNAIEAVAKCSYKKSIEVTMHVRGRYLFVETINPYADKIILDEKTVILPSTKGEGHGYGMKAMSEIAQKYSSKLQVKLEGDMIIVRTALLMPKKLDE